MRNRQEHRCSVLLPTLLASIVAGCGGGSSSGPAPEPERAEFIGNGVRYDFEYQLDENRSVSAYRIFRKSSVAYPTAEADDPYVAACTGNLRGDYTCSSSSASMRGTRGLLAEVRVASGSESIALNWRGADLDTVNYQSSGPGSHVTTTWRDTYSYDGAGRPVRIVRDFRQNAPLCILQSWASSLTLTQDDRLAVAQRIETAPPPTSDRCTVFASSPAIEKWNYSARGLMTEHITELLAPNGTSAGGTRLQYEVSSSDWVTVRRLMTLSGQVQETDTYAMVLDSNGLVAEEFFTQAEPKIFYRSRSPQTVRYEKGRLPGEPLFIPRALSGKRGADHMGVVSSHHR